MISNSQLVIIGLVVVMIAVIFRKKSPRIELKLSDHKVCEGDLVLYSDSNNSETNERNLVTMVLAVFPEHSTALIRVTGTQLVVHQKHLQVLKIDRAFPIRVPDKPKAQLRTLDVDEESIYQDVFEGESIPRGAFIVSPGNRALFRSIPLSWFKYGLNVDKGNRLVTYN